MNPSDTRTAQVTCAEADERSGRWEEALAAYSDVLYHDETPTDLIVDAALGAGRAAWQTAGPAASAELLGCLLYTSDAADE